MIHQFGKLVLLIYRKLLGLINPKCFNEFTGEYNKELQRLKDFCGNDFDRKQLGDKNEVFKEWELYIKDNFSSKTPEDFYLNWTGEFGILAVAVNIHDQFRRFELYLKLKKYTHNLNSFIDIGCGSAAIYWSMLSNKKSYLVDVENENQRYLKHKIRPGINAFFGDISIIPNDFQAEVVCVIDVLEHLEHPSDFFLKNVHPFLKKGGLLFIQAPWGGIPEHLPEAPVNWNQSGKKVLAEKYDLVSPINHIFHITNYYISGVYRKKTE